MQQAGLVEMESVYFKLEDISKEVTSELDHEWHEKDTRWSGAGHSWQREHQVQRPRQNKFSMFKE